MSEQQTSTVVTDAEYSHLVKHIYAPTDGRLTTNRWQIARPNKSTTASICSLEDQHTGARITFKSIKTPTPESDTQLKVYVETETINLELIDDQNKDSEKLIYTETFPQLELATWLAEYFARYIHRFHNETL